MRVWPRLDHGFSTELGSLPSLGRPLWRPHRKASYSVLLAKRWFKRMDPPFPGSRIERTYKFCAAKRSFKNGQTMVQVTKLRFIVLFLGGTATRRVQLSGKAEPRSAASAQASFPSRRARERKGVRK